MNKDFIYKKSLLHEIGHVIAKKPQKEKYTLEESLKYLKEQLNNRKDRSLIDSMGYILSPEEFFCNAYALLNK